MKKISSEKREDESGRRKRTGKFLKKRGESKEFGTKAMWTDLEWREKGPGFSGASITKTNEGATAWLSTLTKERDALIPKSAGLVNGAKGGGRKRAASRREAKGLGMFKVPLENRNG